MKDEVLIDLGKATELTMAPFLDGDVKDGAVDQNGNELWIRFDS